MVILIDQRNIKILWLSFQGAYWRKKQKAWKNWDTDISHLASHEAPML
jgi:hypothetical protein